MHYFELRLLVTIASLMTRKIVLLFLLVGVVVAAVFAVVHYTDRDLRLGRLTDASAITRTTNAFSWSEAVEKVKAPRTDGAGAINTPPELRHYSERYWFLATQVAEIEKHRVYTCQDFLDLAALIQRGELVVVPAVTDSYVLFGIGERADDSEFTRYEGEPNTEVSGTPQKRIGDIEALAALARNIAGRSFDLNTPYDRETLKIIMLSSVRPEALRVIEEVAQAYRRQFDRPLPVSSLVRPEQYQRALRRVNRNAILIETPPHSTGLAFDIDYRYLSAEEQNFVMAELARLKREGRIEVIRERNANYHVFAFINGIRPSDDLITAALERAKPPDQAAHHAAAEPAKTKVKAKPRAGKPRRSRATVRRRRR